jgi:hypothetical protein
MFKIKHFLIVQAVATAGQAVEKSFIRHLAKKTLEE